MRIYICDDEPQILKTITAKIRSLLPEDSVTAFSSGQMLWEALEEAGCDLLFLDIDMPGLNGMDIAHHLNHKKLRPLLIFVTSHDELVYESLQYHPFGFIRKSYFDQEIENVLSGCKKELASNRKHFHFRMAGCEVAILLADILYFEADGNYLTIHTKTEQYHFRSTVFATENALKNDGFVRVHKGFLVNLQSVRVIGNEELILINGSTIPLGKNYADHAKKQFLQYMRI